MLSPEVEAVVIPWVLQEVPVRRAAFTRQEDDGITIVHNEVLGSFEYLNATGSLVYSLCDGLHTIDDVVQALQERYPKVPWQQLVYDTIKCLRDFRGRGLLTAQRCQL